MYVPKPGSKIEAAFAFITKSGAARTLQICEATGIDKTSLNTLLRPAVEAGALVCCKVETPGGAPQNEYRIGGGQAAPAWREIAVNPKKRPDVMTSDIVLEAKSVAAATEALTPAAPEPRKAEPPASVAPRAPAAAIPFVFAAARGTEARDTEQRYRFCVWDDGSVEIVGDDQMIRLSEKEVDRLFRMAGAVGVEMGRA